MADRVRIPPLLVNHRLGRLTCSGNGLLLDDLPYEALVDCYQVENVSRGNMGPTALKLAVQCKFRGQPHNGEKALLLARLQGRDNEMTQEFLQLTRMMNREFHLQQQSAAQTNLDEQAEIDLRERFFTTADQADHVEQCYDVSTHLNALQRAADSLGLIIQSTQGPNDVSVDKHHIVIGRQRPIVSDRIQRINRSLYQEQRTIQSQPLLPLENLSPSVGSPTGVVAIIDPNPPYAITGKWLLQSETPSLTYPLRIWNFETPGYGRQIYCKLDLSDTDTYLLRLIDPSLSTVHRDPSHVLAAFSIPASRAPSAALPDWNFLWRNRGLETNTGSMSFEGEFGFGLVVRLNGGSGGGSGNGEEGVVLRGYKSGEADGVEMNIEVEWARFSLR